MYVCMYVGLLRRAGSIRNEEDVDRRCAKLGGGECTGVCLRLLREETIGEDVEHARVSKGGESISSLYKK